MAARPSGCPLAYPGFCFLSERVLMPASGVPAADGGKSKKSAVLGGLWREGGLGCSDTVFLVVLMCSWVASHTSTCAAPQHD
jgi:hypothetical protein